MKRIKFTTAEIKHFLETFAKSLVKDGVFVFVVNTTCNKNRFKLAIRSNDVLYQVRAVSSNSKETWNHMSIVGCANSLFVKYNPMIILRPQTIAIDEFVKTYGINEDELMCGILKYLKNEMSKAIKLSWRGDDKMHFYAIFHPMQSYYDANGEKNAHCDDFFATADVSTIEELAIWCDLKDINK